MKRSSLALRPLSLLVPGLLLGAALLLRARLPRPQTEGDKWLWEQGEKVPQLDIDPQSMSEPAFAAKSGLQDRQHLVITDRQGIRAVLRSFEGTPAFKPSGPDSFVGSETRMVYSAHDSLDDALVLALGSDGQYYLSCVKGHAPLSKRSLLHFYATLQKAVGQARHRQPGYSLYTGGI